MYTIESMTVAAARDIVTWQYASPYDIYNPGSTGPQGVNVPGTDPRDAISREFSGPSPARDSAPPEIPKRHNLTNDEATVEFFLDPRNHYFAVRDGKNQLIGYCCFGADARVPGGDYGDDAALDIGVGMHPAFTGQGRGHAFVGAVIDFARAQHAPKRLRATIAQFNHRSQRTFAGWGFTPLQHFVSATDAPRAFVVLGRET